MTTDGFVLTRAVHLGACLLLFGILAFDRLVAVPALSGGQPAVAAFWGSWLRKSGVILLPTILLSGLAWFALVSATMSGLPVREVLQMETLKTVWSQTEFGTVWKWRLTFWLGAVAAFLLQPKATSSWRDKFGWMEFLASGLLLGSLAWAGHGLEGPWWHLPADVLHLLVAGLWPAGLLPFAWLLRQLRRGSGLERWSSIADLVRRFSALSLAAVTALAVTGFVNAWFLVGSVENLFGEVYGRWLLTKIILFGITVVIGAINLLRLKPRLLADNLPPHNGEIAASRLQHNVQLELILSTGIIFVVAILGILPPADIH